MRRWDHARGPAAGSRMEAENAQSYRLGKILSRKG
jgi:hypothetical protein